MPKQKQSTRIYDNDFLERLSHVNPRTPFILFIPIIIGFLLYSVVVLKLTPLTLVVLFLLGIIVDWTLFEYLFHRFVFHLKPRSEQMRQIVYPIHQLHHDHPDEWDRLVIPPATSLPMAALVFILHYVFLGIYSFPLMAGFITGYLYYDFVHYSVHSKRKSILIFLFQRRYHLKHHFQNEKKFFGISNPIWDYVFGTLIRD